MYKVIKHFIDLHDNDHSYNEGDIFPREGVDVSKERIEELAGSNNKQHSPLIELVEETLDNATDTDVDENHQKPERRNPKIKSRQNRRIV